VIEEAAKEEEESGDGSGSDDISGTDDDSSDEDSNGDRGDDNDKPIGDDAVGMGSSSIPSPISKILSDIAEEQGVPLEEGEILNTKGGPPQYQQLTFEP